MSRVHFVKAVTLQQGGTFANVARDELRFGMAMVQTRQPRGEWLQSSVRIEEAGERGFGIPAGSWNSISGFPPHTQHVLRPKQKAANITVGIRTYCDDVMYPPSSHIIDKPEILHQNH